MHHPTVLPKSEKQAKPKLIELAMGMSAMGTFDSSSLDAEYSIHDDQNWQFVRSAPVHPTWGERRL